MNGHNPSRLPARLVPDEPFPPYSYVTGRFPHPMSDPLGHSFGHAPTVVARLQPDRWNESRGYLFACDLFNHGYYWESHELWESLWHACGRRETTAEMLKGLIKLAAAGVKAREGRIAGVARHAARAAELFDIVLAEIAGPTYLGLDLAWLISIAHGLRERPVTLPLTGEAVEVVFDFHLAPTLPG